MKKKEISMLIRSLQGTVASLLELLQGELEN